MDLNKTKETYGQSELGTDSPGTGEVVEQADPGSSSRDCEAFVVGDQATASTSVTGREEKMMSEMLVIDAEKEIFARKPRVVRSPAKEITRETTEESVLLTPTRVRAATWGCSVRGTVAQMEGEYAKKRKYTEDSPPKTQVTSITEVEHKLISKLRSKTDDLNKFVKENKNVHKEIKAWATEINSIVNRVTNEYKNEKEVISERRQKAEERIRNQEEIIRTLRNDIICMKEEQIRHLEQIKKLEKELARQVSKEGQNGGTIEPQFDLNEIEISTYEEFVNVQDKNWTPSSFVCTEIKTEDPAKCNDGNMILFMDIEPKRRTRISKMFLNRYPELLHGEKIECQGGSYVAIEQTVSYLIQKTQKKMTRRLTTVYYDPTKQDGRTEQDVFHILKEMTKIINTAEEKMATIVCPVGILGEKFRKMVEVNYHNMGYKINIILSRRNDKEEERQRKKRGEAILIRKDDSVSYADTVRKLKEGLKEEQLVKENIKGVRKTKNGELLIKIAKEDTKTNDKIKEIFEGRKAISLGGVRTKVLHVRDLDITIETGEIEEALKDAGYISIPEKFIVKSVRPTKNENKIATLLVAEEDANRLLKMGKVKIGFEICRIEERITLRRCYKCWQYDHQAKECTGEDRKDICQRCTKEGHIARDCQEIPYCPLCNEQGHQAGSGKCRSFIRALTAAKDKRKK